MGGPHSDTVKSAYLLCLTVSRQGCLGCGKYVELIQPYLEAKK